ncbi:ubiquitin-conjugating enzyme E2 J2 isoform X1 [Cynocephalus volans]|uniref:ubiquitin-conjugating enzyme E2 J2 isoform X1 n=2 Tax=Cynocephalus volans TaxID=110931 RepID=UPI002FC6C244
MARLKATRAWSAPGRGEMVTSRWLLKAGVWSTTLRNWDEVEDWKLWTEPCFWCEKVQLLFRAGGYYHGKLIFPREFPFKPPSIYMITPNGRFKCNTRLCLSITDFHPDTWNPAWSVSTILTGLLSFMVEKGPTLGSIETSDFTKRQLAAQSLAFNLKDKVFCELFSEVVEEIKQKQKAQDDISGRPQTLPLPDVVPDGETHHGQNGIVLLNGHAPGAGPNLVGLQQANRHHGLLGGALANLFVIVGFAAFAYTVKYVLRSIAQE